MKKGIYIAFLLLANIALLVHAVVPHHHHSGRPETMCVALHEHAEGEHPQGEAGANTGLEDCLLNRAYVKADSSEPVLRPADEGHAGAVCVLFLCPECAVSRMTACVGLPVRLKPYLPFVPAEYIARSVGLRAPPVC